MGASCVRDCERTAHELYTTEDALPLQVGMPGLSTSGLQSATTPAAPPEGAVKVGYASSNPMALIQGGNSNRGSGTPAVPPLDNWFQVFKAGRGDASSSSPKETPRFDEVTPRGSAGPTPRESPRPPDERQTDASQGTARIDEISYEGTYLGNMKHGTGRLRMNGCTYEGDFKNDMKHGNGVLTWDDGRQYRGQFEEGKFHGAAVMTWPDGRKYCGQYVEDRKHGDGTFSWQDGRRYQGQWVVGKRHGIGVYTNAKGLTRTGTWNMDRPLHWEQATATLPQTSASARKLPLPVSPESEAEAGPAATVPQPAWNGSGVGATVGGTDTGSPARVRGQKEV